VWCSRYATCEGKIQDSEVVRFLRKTQKRHTKELLPIDFVLAQNVIISTTFRPNLSDSR
jgi:hypothetical protein